MNPDRMSQPGVAFPLSSAQLGIWFAQQLDPWLNPHIAVYLDIAGCIDPALFEQALRRVVDETDSLRVRITADDDGPRQTIVATPAWPMPIIDVSAELDPRASAEAWMRADLSKRTEATDFPLFGFALFKAATDRYFWYARYHHIVVDGFGMRLIANRLAEIYTQLHTGKALHDDPFKPLAVLVEEDAAYRASEQFTKDRDFWLGSLADRPGPVGFAGHSSVRSDGVIRVTGHLDAASTAQLRAMSRRTMAQMVTASAAILLHRLTGAPDLVIGLVAAPRTEVTRHIPGMATNILPLRLGVHGRASIAEVLEQTALQMRRALGHQRYHISDLRRDLGAADDGRSLFSVGVNVMRFDYGFDFAGCKAVASNLAIGPVEDLLISIYDRSDGEPIRVDFDANPARYDTAEIADCQKRFLKLLGVATCSPPDRTIGALDILGAEERRKLLIEFNDTARAVRSASLPELVGEQAGRRPGAVAVVGAAETLSYAELEDRANRLAHHLRGLGVGPEAVVGLCVERSPSLVVGALGILKAGGAYLPLDPSHPAERLGYMLADARAAAVVTEAGLEGRLGAAGGVVRVRLDADAAALAAASRHRPAAVPRPGATPPMSSTPPAPPAPPKASSSAMPEYPVGGGARSRSLCHYGAGARLLVCFAGL